MPRVGADSFAADPARLRLEIEQLRLENEHLVESVRILERTYAQSLEMFDLAPFPLLSVNRAGLIEHANHAAGTLLGRGRADLIGRAMRSFVVPDDRQLLGQALARTRSGAEAETCDLRLAGTASPPVPARLSIRRASDDGGSLHVGVLDLRERDSIVAELRRLSDAEQIARQENVAKGNFIAVLSHELRTPLTPVLAASSLMVGRKGIPPEAVAAFAMIKRNVAMETRLIDDLLDVSRIARGKLRVRLEPVDVHDVVMEAVGMLRQDAVDKQQAIHHELHADRHLVEADAARLRQVFANLLRNAIKFTPRGGAVYVRSWNSGSKLTVEIEDTGIGISADAISRLFVPFEQVDNSWTGRNANGGLGLGLAISKGIVDLHGGSISVGSPGPGRGARFAVQLETLDARTQDAAVQRGPDRSVAPSSVDQSADNAEQRRPRILLVDDHADTLAVMTDVLNDLGCEVETATSVKSALAIDLDRVDIIVSDIGLPDGTGMDLMRELRAEGKSRPAIALSGFGMEADIQASRDAGFDLHLTKPVDVDVLFATIRQLIDGHGTGLHGAQPGTRP